MGFGPGFQVLSSAQTSKFWHWPGRLPVGVMSKWTEPILKESLNLGPGEGQNTPVYSATILQWTQLCLLPGRRVLPLLVAQAQAVAADPRGAAADPRGAAAARGFGGMARRRRRRRCPRAARKPPQPPMAPASATATGRLGGPAGPGFKRPGRLQVDVAEDPHQGGPGNGSGLDVELPVASPCGLTMLERSVENHRWIRDRRRRQ